MPASFSFSLTLMVVVVLPEEDGPAMMTMRTSGRRSMIFSAPRADFVVVALFAVARSGPGTCPSAMIWLRPSTVSQPWSMFQRRTS